MLVPHIPRSPYVLRRMSRQASPPGRTRMPHEHLDGCGVRFYKHENAGIGVRCKATADERGGCLECRLARRHITRLAGSACAPVVYEHRH
ncbi:hypothetical protein EVAR_19351_1 [Eumeta japonica]|uniref:Uncharacterized protein n=1 Tax=Eumeta variegata TaxID=151549 RepID=A0A4C1TRD7_EUMVA|nr:hypothetical protein EVAR_19351_1 [Eumeta japonica]